MTVHQKLLSSSTFVRLGAKEVDGEGDSFLRRCWCCGTKEIGHSHPTDVVSSRHECMLHCCCKMGLQWGNRGKRFAHLVCHARALPTVLTFLIMIVCKDYVQMDKRVDRKESLEHIHKHDIRFGLSMAR